MEVEACAFDQFHQFGVSATCLWGGEGECLHTSLESFFFLVIEVVA